VRVSFMQAAQTVQAENNAHNEEQTCH
jgi:hypothetical protein